MVCVFWSSWWTMRHCGIMGGDSWDYLFLVEQASVLSSLYRSRPCNDHPPYFDCPLLARVYRPRQASEYILIACLPPTIHSSTLSGCDGSFFAWNESYLLSIFGTQSLLHLDVVVVSFFTLLLLGGNGGSLFCFGNFARDKQRWHLSQVFLIMT